jgi:hypothetical protein
MRLSEEHYDRYKAGRVDFLPLRPSKNRVLHRQKMQISTDFRNILRISRRKPAAFLEWRIIRRDYSTCVEESSIDCSCDK